ncbi:MAG TPA: helix-turn-helix domain-containing protein [Hadesarchaea archaeon]|nr:helix-turn-helix domain-containing protein [Hadesarchaea archaeon]
MINMVRKGLSKKVVAKIFGVSRVTVWKWCKRVKHLGRESLRSAETAEERQNSQESRAFDRQVET